MPLFIIREDITKMTCDAIVNPSNEELIPGGGTDAAIHRAAGPELLAACAALGGIKVGEVKATKGFRLPAKYVFHTAGPVWAEGKEGEEKILAACYENALLLADSLGCESIAFPLISAGTYGFPRDLAMRIANETVTRFLEAHEMTVYLVVYDRESYLVSERVFRDVMAYIDDCYAEKNQMPLGNYEYSPRIRRRMPRMEEALLDVSYAASDCMPSALPDLDDMLRHLDRGFAETLFALIDEKGITDVECYKRANVDKKTFSKIKCNKDYKPSKVTAVSFAIALRLTLEETNALLSTVGMCLSHSNKFDVIIEYFLVTGNYETIYDVNETLFRFDQVLLGV